MSLSRRQFLTLAGLLAWRLPRFYQSSRAQAFLGQMTLRQKVGQIFLFSASGSAYSDEMRSLIAEREAGGMVLFGYNISTPEALTELTNTLQREALRNGLPIPLMIGIDQEGGNVARLRGDGFTLFPSPMALGAADDLGFTQQFGAAIAEELKACGVNLNLAPVLDVNTQAQNPVINIRSFGETPRKVAEHGAAFIQGTHSHNVIATGKHFPGHGSTHEDSHYSLPIVTLDRQAVLEEMQPFATGIVAQLGAMMTAHVVYRALDETPATFSPRIMTDLLRGELGFQGVLMSDALTMGAVSQARENPIYILRDALLAGVDMLAYGAPLNGQNSFAEQLSLYETVVALVESGLVPPSRLDEAVLRVLSLKERFGILDWGAVEVESTRQRMNLAAHAALVGQIAQKSVTLLRDGLDILPLKSNQALALIYPNEYISAATILKQAFTDVLELPYNLSPSVGEINFIGSNIGERVALCLTADSAKNPAQVDLINQLPLERAIVVALQSPYDILQFPLIQTYFMTYGYTAAACQTLADILLGLRLAQGIAPLSLQS